MTSFCSVHLLLVSAYEHHADCIAVQCELCLCGDEGFTQLQEGLTSSSSKFQLDKRQRQEATHVLRSGMLGGGPSDLGSSTQVLMQQVSFLCKSPRVQSFLPVD